MPSEQPSRDDRSLGELLGELMRETTTLVRQEISLAKTEISQKAADTGKKVGTLAVGGAIAYAGLLVILAAVVLLLIQNDMSPWIAALLVGVVVAAIGGFLVMKSISALKEQNLTPDQTIESLKEDKKWIQEQVR